MLDFFCNSSFTVCYPKKSIILSPGIYRVECWGASGGSNIGEGGRGGYSAGSLLIKRKTKIHVFIGEEGIAGSAKKTFNGGGSGSKSGASGGGSSDIRLVDSGDFEGLASRIIVAGGGGGGNSHATSSKGGSSGGLGGFPGSEAAGINNIGNSIPPTGGDQISGGFGGQCVKHETGNCRANHGTNGSFGYGGNAPHERYGSGGGGGFFGGGGGNDALFSTTSGAGGSSYISGHPNSRAIDIVHSTSSIVFTLNTSNHYSGITFYDTIMENGEKRSGHTGSGAIKIVQLESLRFNTCHSKHTLSCFHLSIILFLIQTK